MTRGGENCRLNSSESSIKVGSGTKGLDVLWTAWENVFPSSKLNPSSLSYEFCFQSGRKTTQSLWSLILMHSPVMIEIFFCRLSLQIFSKFFADLYLTLTFFNWGTRLFQSDAKDTMLTIPNWSEDFEEVPVCVWLFTNSENNFCSSSVITGKQTPLPCCPINHFEDAASWKIVSSSV